MDINLKWKKEFFSKLYTIYSEGQPVGTLKDKTFSQIAIGELNGKQYTFKTKGFFKQHTEIIDNLAKKVIAVLVPIWSTVLN